MWEYQFAEDEDGQHAVIIPSGALHHNLLPSLCSDAGWATFCYVVYDDAFPGIGCHVGNIIGSRWEDCDFENGIISFNHNTLYQKYEGDKESHFHITVPKEVIDGHTGFIFQYR